MEHVIVVRHNPDIKGRRYDEATLDHHITRVGFDLCPKSRILVIFM
jgi:hypothetical protein